MTQWANWLAAHWLDLVVPLLVFLATYIVGLWLRFLLFRLAGRTGGWTQWRGSKVVAESIRRPFSDWFLLLGAYIATQVSVLTPYYKDLAGKIIASLFVLSLAWVAANIVEKLINIYAPNAKTAQRPRIVIINVIRVTIIVIAALIILDIWGAPVSPILLVIAVVVFIAGIALRDTIPSYFSSIQIASSKQIKAGDFIRLDSGESGEVVSINWQNTQMKSLDGHIIIVPNNKIARATLVNYGRPLRKASSPFHFYTRLHLRELTGLKACNVTELLAILKEVPESVVYYHVHHFLEEHLYLTPEPANDFAIWVSNSLGNDLLSEQLASVDPFAFPNMGNLRQRLIEVIEDFLRNNPDRNRCTEGEEFHFIRSISFILPTPYIAHDLREFVEILRKVTVDSIYFHIYEARLRLQRGTNDFSIWMTDSLGEKELADKIAGIDPYVYTLESLRNKIIEQTESHIS